jgi:hypothetical protein
LNFAVSELRRWCCQCAKIRPSRTNKHLERFTFTKALLAKGYTATNMRALRIFGTALSVGGVGLLVLFVLLQALNYFRPFQH